MPSANILFNSPQTWKTDLKWRLCWRRRSARKTWRGLSKSITRSCRRERYPHFIVLSQYKLVKLPLIWIYFLLSYKVSSGSQFEYAWCLVRSRYPADIRKGIILLEDLLKNREETNKRDYLYYLSIGNTRLKEYATALRFIRALLQIEPGNRQAQVDHNLTLTYRPTHFYRDSCNENKDFLSQHSPK